jgi:hypothetical protein
MHVHVAHMLERVHGIVGAAALSNMVDIRLCSWLSHQCHPVNSKDGCKKTKKHKP